MASEDSLIGMVTIPMAKWLKTRHAWASLAGTMILLVGLAWLFAYQAEAFPAADPYNAGSINPHPGIPGDAEREVLSNSGYASEGSAIDEPFDLLGTRIWTMRVMVTATDEPPARNFRFTNEADDFEVTVSFPDGTSRSVSGYCTDTTQMVLTMDFNWSEDGGMDLTDEGGNTVTVTVECTVADDHYPFFSPFGVRTIADEGNAYSVEVDYSYTE